METIIAKLKINKPRRLLFASVVFTMISIAIINSGFRQLIYSISGGASAAQMVPATGVNGTATMNGDYNDESNVLEFTSNWNNLSGGPVSASFYIGEAGMTGKIFGDTWPLGTNNKPTGSITHRITLSDEQEKQLLAGNIYYAYTTSLNPGGEVRGQIKVKN